MNRKVVSAGLRGVLFVLSAMMIASTQAEETPAEGKSLELFNGHDLTGWYVYTTATQFENPGVFQVVDGAIYVPGGKDDIAYLGGLITDNSYENYRLRFEFKWGKNTYGARKNKARDAGILLHCVGANGPGPWMTSFEYQIIEGGVGDLLVVDSPRLEGQQKTPPITCVGLAELRDAQPYFTSSGKRTVFLNKTRLNWWGRDPAWQDQVGFRGKLDVESPLGEWTRCEIIARGNELQYFVNGQLVNQVSELSHTKGKLLFQTEGAELWYRKIQLTPLEPALSGK